MEHEVPRHQKIRFRRDEIANLCAFPSAAEQDFGDRSRRIGKRAGKVLVGSVAGGAVVVGLITALLYLVGLSGISTGPLRDEAARAVSAFAGVEVDAAMGPASLSIDASRLVAFEVRDVSISAKQGAPIVQAGVVRFGVRFLPLFGGNIRLGSVNISDARISAAAMPMADQGDWTKILKNDQGLIDPDKVSTAIFAEIHRAFDALQVGSTRQIELENVEIVLPEDGRVRIVRIDYARLTAAGQGEMIFSADVEIDGRKVQLSGTSTRDAVSKRISALEMIATTTAGNARRQPGAGQGASVFGDFELALSGQEGIGADPDRLTASATLGNSALDLGKDGTFEGGVDLHATLLGGSDKLEIDRLRVTSGRSRLEFNGAIGPRPPTGGADDKPSYRYELVSSNATVAPLDSSEPALDFMARVSGTFDADKMLLAADQIAVGSGAGEALGQASLDLTGSDAPGVSLDLKVRDMPISHVKQLWPWFAARGARNWVMDHLFGGRVVDADIRFQVPPDRLGNGIPLQADEVSGRFQVEGTRFDTAGVIPPVRDAIGQIEFRGNDVDVSLSSGTVYLPSGRSVAASNGKLRIEKANRPPLIGMLDIDVAGDAAAITELASYEPINAMRFVGMKPEEFSGTVTGNVKADIPLQKDIAANRLDWRVTLDYEGLSLANPVDNQKISDANGSIVIEPHKAVINAAARLNGVPAEINLVEPLGKDGPPRDRKVQLMLDDKAREAIAPGLSSLVSGTIKVNLDADGDRQKITADLTGAQLDIPWVGWSKGPGVAANLSFWLEKSKGVSTLSDFKLAGQSFAINGAVTLADGNFSSARFGTVRLNRDDDVAVSIKRTGKSFAIDITGNALDARPLIKQFTSDVGSGGKPNSGSTPVSINLDVRALTGFGGEQLSNVLLSYSGASSQIDGMSVTATTKSGGAVSVRNAFDGSQHSLQMQSADAGALLRFLNIYDHMQGGAIKMALSDGGGGPMRGKIDASNFWVVNEPKLASIVSTTPPGDERSLSQAVKRDIDTSRVQFERGSAQIEKGPSYLKIVNGVLRGPLIGTTFQGTLYDQNGNMAMTGTFMPAYGLNRIFGEIPIFGAILGNGRDRGLIGVTYKLQGDAKTPNLQINPLSVIAPGIFRSIFEFQ